MNLFDSEFGWWIKGCVSLAILIAATWAMSGRRRCKHPIPQRRLVTLMGSPDNPREMEVICGRCGAVIE